MAYISTDPAPNTDNGVTLTEALETLQRGLDADNSGLVVMKVDNTSIDPAILLLGRIGEPRTTR